MFDRFVAQCRGIIECDTARISKPCNRMFLIIGFNRNTKDDEWPWYRNGEQYDFDYVREQVVASGDTEEELLRSTREYKRLCGITMEEYLSESTAGQ